MKPLQSSFYSLITCTLITSTIMILSSSNWLLLWCGLEINLLSFIPMLSNSSKFQEHEATTKYFLVQALGSSLILLSSISLWSTTTFIPSAQLILIALILKMGMAPCHFWFPSVMSSISWMNCLILSTWQKLGPLMILAYLSHSQNIKFLLIPLSCLSAITGGLLGMNQNKMKSIMAYSSITHMGWMTSPLISSNPSTTLLYFILYTLLIIPMFLYMNHLTTDSQPQLLKSLKSSPEATHTTCLIILSLSGLPPLLGFFPKLLILSNLLPSMFMVPLLLILGAMMNMYFYLNIVFSMILSYSSQPLQSMYTPTNLNLSTLISLSFLSIPILLIL